MAGQLLHHYRARKSRSRSASGAARRGHTSPAGDAMARSDRTRDRSARDAAAPPLRCRGDRRRAETERVLNLTSAMTLDAPIRLGEQTALFGTPILRSAERRAGYAFVRSFCSSMSP